MRKGAWDDKALLDSDVVMSGLRAVELFERRNEEGKITFYCSERWFKPLMFGLFGILRLMIPSYWRMARRFMKCAEGQKFWLLPIGVHAARDMARLWGIMHGNWKCWFCAPELCFERIPVGKISLSAKCTNSEGRYGLDRMKLWGYFVDKSEADGYNEKNALPVEKPDNTRPVCRILWVGRLLDLKRVEDIVRAVGANADLKRVGDSGLNVTLDIYGRGARGTETKTSCSKIAYR